MPKSRDRVIVREYGKERFIRREQAEELKDAGIASYDGDADGESPSMVVHTQFFWRKKTKRTAFGMPLGVAGMELCRQ